MKTTNLKLSELMDGRDFEATVAAVTKSSTALEIDGNTYSLKTPVDFTLNEIAAGDVITISPRLKGTRINLFILDLKKD